VRYALIGIVAVALLGGAYCWGYSSGSADRKIEYIEKEVIKYVETNKKTSAIYSVRNINRDTALRLFNDGML
jgi:hypothetical protein